jgi:D-tyrosyl-tRNA(Tyr) deacylase
MRIVVQRVHSAEVRAGTETAGKIGRGLLIYVGMEKHDSEEEVVFMAEKVLNLRIFPDGNGRMDIPVTGIPDSAILSISQFTLASYIKKGRRPDFSNALEPNRAEELYNLFNLKLSEKVRVEQGIFGAMMDVSSVNDGPVTFIMEKNHRN